MYYYFSKSDISWTIKCTHNPIDLHCSLTNTSHLVAKIPKVTSYKPLRIPVKLLMILFTLFNYLSCHLVVIELIQQKEKSVFSVEKNPQKTLDHVFSLVCSVFAYLHASTCTE